MYNTKITDWRTVPGVYISCTAQGHCAVEPGSTRLICELQSDAWTVTSSALLAGFFNCIWRDVHTESFLGKKQPTHIVRRINHLVTRACVVSSVAYFFSVTNSICLRNADFQDIKRCHLCADPRSVSSSSAKPSICRAVDCYKERTKIRQ